MKLDRQALLRFAAPAVLLLGAALFLQARSRPEPQPQRLPLAEFPRQLAGWDSKEVPVSQEVRDILGPGDFLSRIYYRPGQPYIDFFVAYFPSQRTGNTIHSPKNCLPGSGWMPTEASYLQLRRPDGAMVTANRYIIANGLDRQLVIYWYQAHGHIVASEYWAKYFLVKDAIAMNRTDGSLVRVITPILSNEETAVAEQRAVRFAEIILGNLDPYIPR